MFEQVSIAEARLAEDRRMATLMIQFNEIMDERRAAQDDTEINRIIASTVTYDEGTPSSPLVDESLKRGNLTYTKMPWEEVCYRAYKVRVVKLAMIGERVALKEACCIVLHALKGSRTSWNDEAVSDQIRELADKLETHPDIMSRISAEYDALPTVPIGDEPEVTE
jgi:hypothetical protein